MSLTLPSVYSGKLGTQFEENWLFKIFYDTDTSNATNCIALSYKDTTVDMFYYGAVLNKPSIRESINLLNSTASTSNVSLDVANFPYKNGLLSDEVFGGSRYYINHVVKIYSQLEGDSTLSNCLQIYEGRLISTSCTDNIVRFEAISKRPWDFIEIPNAKTTAKTYIPVVYGDYTHNSVSSSVNSAVKNYNITSQSLHPVPFDEFTSGKLFYIDGLENNSSNAHLHVYEKGSDIFPAITDSDTAGTDKTSHYAVGVKPDVKRSFALLPTNIEEYDKGTLQTDNVTYSDDGTVSVSNLSNIYNENAVQFATFTLASTTDDQIIGWEGTVTFPSISGLSSDSFKPVLNSSGSRVVTAEAVNDSETTIDVSDNSPFNADEIIKIGQDAPESMLVQSTGSLSGQEYINVLRGFGQSTSPTTSECTSGTQLHKNQTQNILKATVKVTVTTATNTGNTQAEVSWGIYGYGTMKSTASTISSLTAYNLAVPKGQTSFTFFVRAVTGDAINVAVDVSELALNVQRIDDNIPDLLYAGTDGLKVDRAYTNSDSADATITNIVDAHVDVLNRYLSYNVSGDASTSNLSALRSARSGWNLRYWELEPRPLKEVLDKMQYEGGFVFRIRADGTSHYIYIPNSPSVASTNVLDKNDIQNLQLSHISYEEIITKTLINYQKHPAENKYISSQTSTRGSGTLPRTKWNIQASENIAKVDLDMLVANQGSTGLGGNKNDGFADYYDAIYGDIKAKVSFRIVNPRLYFLETGDLIGFDNDNMPVKLFASAWTDKVFIITSLSRRLGEINISAREV